METVPRTSHLRLADPGVRAPAGVHQLVLITAVLLLVTLFFSPSSFAQEIRLSAGSVHSAPVLADTWSHAPAGRLSLSLPASDLFHFYGGVGLGEAVSLEGGARIRPWRRGAAEPYFEVGYARYAFAARRTSALPVGGGVLYRFGRRVGVGVELEHRFVALEQPPDAGLAAPPPVQSAWAARATLSLGLGGGEETGGPAEPESFASGEGAPREGVSITERTYLASVRLSAGSSFSEPVVGQKWTQEAAGRLSLGLPVSDLFDFYGGVGYGPATSIALGARIRPWRGAWVEPYLEAGYGRYVGAEGQTSVLPVSGGLHFRTRSPFGFFLEIEHSFRAIENPPGATDPAPPEVQSSWTPRAGLSIGFGGRSGGEAALPRRPTPLRPISVPAAVDEVGVGGSVPEYREPASPMAQRSTSAFYSREDGPLFDQVLVTGLSSPAARTGPAFYLDATEVTNGRYRAYLRGLSPEERAAASPEHSLWTEAGFRMGWADLYFTGWPFRNFPVVGVSFEQAARFCRAQGGRLPTELEWEYAARARHMGDVSPGEAFRVRGEEGEPLANYSPREGPAADDYVFAAPVGSFSSNAWGLYDMLGNVAEWTRSPYASSSGPSGNGSTRLVRGGSWASSGRFFENGAREIRRPTEASLEVGFRCVRELDGRKQPEVQSAGGDVPRGGGRN